MKPTPRPDNTRHNEPRTATRTEPVRQRVRVWFGSHAICTYSGEPEPVRRYATLIQRRFAGLRVTVETLAPPNTDTRERTATTTELPTDSRLWPLTIR